jgi:hypothetical protein
MMGPALLVSIPMILLARGGGSGGILLLAAGFAGMWAFLSPQVRLYLHGLALLAVAAGISLAALKARGHGATRWGAAALLAAMMFSLGNLAVMQKALSDPFAVVLGMESRERYLARMVDGHAAIDFINRELPAEAKVLFVGEIYGYYCRRDYLLGSKFDRSPIVDLIANSETLDDFLQRLRQQNFTHLLYSMHQLEKFADLPGTYLDWPHERARQIYREFMVDRLEMVFESPEAVVGRIRFSASGEGRTGGASP